MIKRSIAISLALLLLLSLPLSALATGDPNIDSGGGGMGTGSDDFKWSKGMEGVRVSLIDVETKATMGTPIDYTNKSPSLDYHFGKVNKLQYKNGAALNPLTSTYQYKEPVSPLPPIIKTSTNNANIEAIKEYFCSEAVAGMIALDYGISFETLISGRYKLLLEPIAYVVFDGKYICLTAHEAALYDQQVSGKIKTKLGSVTHQNLPLSMFLERPDLGFSPYSGAMSGKLDNNSILKYLGIGTVTYTEEFPEPETLDMKYRVNTEVITAVTLNTISEINPDAPATVTFDIEGEIHTMSNVVIPEEESQVVWCKWTTPDTEREITINISTNKGYLSENCVIATIVDLDKNPPPDPKADDRNDDFQTASLPNKTQQTAARWTVWRAEWEAKWVWYPNWVWETSSGGYWRDIGEWRDEGEYIFFTDIYTAALTAQSTVKPDSKVPTASGNTMKSGYGISNTVTASLTTGAPNSHITGAQTAVSYFPEFKYKTYWRLHDLTVRGRSSTLELQNNEYSTYNQRVHFTPVWYPDGTYKAYTWLLDAWTPDGMLSMNLNDSVNISGSVFDDWHIGPK